MKKISEIIDFIESEKAGGALAGIYSGENIDRQKKRYLSLLREHRELFGDVQAMVISAPGRTELGGNHTDHNLGMVLAGSTEFDSAGVVSVSDDDTIIFASAGWDSISLKASDDEYRPGEQETTVSLIRGVLRRFSELGYLSGGFNLNMDSEVLRGSGLSSSASVEILIGTVINELFNSGEVSLVEIAKTGQYAENNYFGKASGLMDQLACAAGGIIGIDFKDPERPEIFPVDYEFRKKGFELMVTNAGSSHANLSAEYSAMPGEMKNVAEYFGKSVCREISMDELKKNITNVRKEAGDRAVLRAAGQIRALRKDDFQEYLRLVNASGNSSFKYLQNVYLGITPRDQSLSVALALTEDFLDGRGACRVQGGGFAGTIQAYIPEKEVDSYVKLMESVFGEGACSGIRIRGEAACRIL
jgi:galactokinase